MYLLKLVIPINLSAIYPYPANAGGSAPAVYWIYVLPVLAIFAAAVYSAKKSKPVLFAILFFSVNIVFVLQLLPVGNVVMADRYAYVPSIGVFFLAGFGYSEWVKKKAATKRYVQGALIVCVFILSFLTNVRCAVWQNSLALWNDVTAKSPTAEVAWYNRGSAKNNTSDHSGALLDFNRAIELKKDYAEAFASRGMVKTNMKDYIGAESDVSEAIRLKPDLAYSYYARGVIRTLRNNLKGAVIDFDQAVAIQKTYPAAYSERGVAKSQLGDLRGAMADFDMAISQDPEYASAYLYRGIGRYTSGDRAGALVDFNTAIQLNPQQTQTYYLRGMVRSDLKDVREACNDWRTGSSLGSHEAAAALEKFCGR
jgi:tetratricopeptide (TPR) repeat protein